ncbi:MAG: protoporphyrinogen oxidase [Myxococcota bacterium]
MVARIPQKVLVVGGGVSGLATAFEMLRLARERGEPLTVRVLESEPWVGGKLRSRKQDGFLIEEAANGWLRATGTTDALCEAVGCGPNIVQANEAAGERYLVAKGVLRALPTSPFKLAASDLLSIAGRLRVAKEPFIAPPVGTEDESIASFGRRRFGPEATELFVDPMVTGVYAGDPERLSFPSCFPKLAALERTHGSLIKGMMAVRKAGTGDGGSVPDSRRLTSLGAGMGSMCEALRVALGDAVRCGGRVVRVEQVGGAYRVHFADGTTEEGDAVVVATPAEAAARMLASLDDPLAREIGGITYNAVAVVALAFPADAVKVRGFGFLAPHRERRRILGTLVETNVFAGRAPTGYVLTRTMVGGTRTRELLEASDDELVTGVRNELADLANILARPTLVQVIRHPRAIAQYEVGHAARLTRIDGRLANHPGLYLTGGAYRGVSVNDCIADATATAKRVLAV